METTKCIDNHLNDGFDFPHDDTVLALQCFLMKTKKKIDEKTTIFYFIMKQFIMFMIF